MHFDASPASPLFHAAILIRNWQRGIPQISLQGKAVNWDQQHRAAVIHTLDGADLLVWIEEESTKPIDITLDSSKANPARHH
jgi:hypothetical protein